MKHLEFVDKLQELGVRISSTSCEGKIKEFEIPGLFKSKTLLQKGFKLEWKEKNEGGGDPLEALLRTAIDMDAWKHSWHMEITPKNYEEIGTIIQKKIINRAQEIDDLMTVYFQLHYEMSNTKL